MWFTVLKAPLTFLDLRFNNFTGPLPNSLFTETDMDVSLPPLKPTKPHEPNFLFSGHLPQRQQLLRRHPRIRKHPHALHHPRQQQVHGSDPGQHCQRGLSSRNLAPRQSVDRKCARGDLRAQEFDRSRCVEQQRFEWYSGAKLQGASGERCAEHQRHFACGIELVVFGWRASDQLTRLSCRLSRAESDIELDDIPRERGQFALISYLECKYCTHGPRS